MESLSATLAGRVEQMLQAYRGREIGSETGILPAVDELLVRNEALEEIVRALTAEQERLTAGPNGRSRSWTSHLRRR